MRSAWGPSKSADEEEESQPIRPVRGREKSATPQPPALDVTRPRSESIERRQDQVKAPPSRGSAGNGPLFDALLLAARGTQPFSRKSQGMQVALPFDVPRAEE